MGDGAKQNLLLYWFSFCFCAQADWNSNEVSDKTKPTFTCVVYLPTFAVRFPFATTPPYTMYILSEFSTVKWTISCIFYDTHRAWRFYTVARWACTENCDPAIVWSTDGSYSSCPTLGCGHLPRRRKLYATAFTITVSWTEELFIGVSRKPYMLVDTNVSNPIGCYRRVETTVWNSINDDTHPTSSVVTPLDFYFSFPFRQAVNFISNRAIYRNGLKFNTPLVIYQSFVLSCKKRNVTIVQYFSLNNIYRWR